LPNDSKDPYSTNYVPPLPIPIPALVSITAPAPTHFLVPIAPKETWVII